jgi:hypothetical protein
MKKVKTNRLIGYVCGLNNTANFSLVQKRAVIEFMIEMGKLINYKSLYIVRIYQFIDELYQVLFREKQ